MDIGMLLSLSSVEVISQIIFNLLASLAVAAAAYRYLRLTGGPRRHTELELEPVWVSAKSGKRLIEIRIRIENRGMELLELYNIFLSVVPERASDWSWRSPNLVSADDEKIWLHAGTGINITQIVPVPDEVDVFRAELVVPYQQSRMPRVLNAVEAAQVSDYNSLERYFSVPDA